MAQASKASKVSKVSRVLESGNAALRDTILESVLWLPDGGLVAETGARAAFVTGI